MVVNFRARGISRGARKLIRTLTLIKNNDTVIIHLNKLTNTYLIENIFFFFTYWVKKLSMIENFIIQKYVSQSYMIIIPSYNIII
jgi:hypothetical protein